MNPIIVSKLRRKKKKKRRVKYSVSTASSAMNDVVANGIIFMFIGRKPKDLSNNNVTTTHYSQSSLLPRRRPIPAEPELKPQNRERKK